MKKVRSTRRKLTKKRKVILSKIHTHPLFSLVVVTFCVLTAFVISRALAAKPQPITGQFELEDITSSGTAPNGQNSVLTMTKDGRYVVFSSSASNLGAPSTGGIFVRDRQTGTTEMVSILPDGSVDPGNPVGAAFISSDGRYVVYDDNVAGAMYLRDRVAHTTTFINDNRGLIYMTSDARYIVYALQSTSFLGHFEHWLLDRQTNTNEELSVNSSGTESDQSSTYQGVLSDDGRYFIFESGATNLVPNHPKGQTDIYIRDRQTRTTNYIYPNGIVPNGSSYAPFVSPDGRYVLFSSSASNLLPNDPDNYEDVYLLDRQTGTLELESLTNSGTKSLGNTGGISMSDDARYILLDSVAPNMNPYKSTSPADYIHDRTTNVTELITQNPTCQALLGIYNPFVTAENLLSNDGRYVAFETYTDGLVPEDTNGLVDVYLRDRTVPFNRLKHHCK